MNKDFSSVSASDFSALLTLLRSEREALFEQSMFIRDELSETLSQLFNSGVSEDELQRVLERLSLVFDRVQTLREDLARYEQRVARFEDLASSCSDEFSGGVRYIVADAAKSSLVSIESLRRSVDMMRTNTSFLSDSNTRFLDDALTGILAGWESIRAGLEAAKAGMKSFSIESLKISNQEQARVVTNQLQNLKSQIDTVLNQGKLFLGMIEKLGVLAGRISQDVTEEFEVRLQAARQDIIDAVSPVEQFSDEFQMQIVDLKVKWHLFDTRLEDEF